MIELFALHVLLVLRDRVFVVELCPLLVLQCQCFRLRSKLRRNRVPAELRADHAAPAMCTVFLFLKKAFHAASENPRDAIQGIGTRFVDILVPLLIHLD